MSAVLNGIQELPSSFGIDGDSFHYRNGKKFGQSLRINLNPALLGFVDHVQNEHHRNVEFHQLGGDQESASQVLRIGNLNDNIRFFAQQNFAGNALVFGLRNQAVYSRGVHNFICNSAQLHLAAGYLDGSPGKIGNQHVVAG